MKKVNISANAVVKIEESRRYRAAPFLLLWVDPFLLFIAPFQFHQFFFYIVAVSVSSVLLLYCRRLLFPAVDLRRFFSTVAVCLRIALAPQ